MWTVSRYRYISCFKNFFLHFFSAKSNFLYLFQQYLLQLQLCLVQILHLLSMKVDSHFYGTSIFRVFKAFSSRIFYMGFYILIWGFSKAISGVFKKTLVGALIILRTILAAYLQSLTQGYSSIAFIVRDRPDIAVDPEQLSVKEKKHNSKFPVYVGLVCDRKSQNELMMYGTGTAQCTSLDWRARPDHLCLIMT